MDYLKILKRAAEITWKHKSTWLFGFLAALFQGGGRFNYNVGSQEVDYTKFSRDSERFMEALFSPVIILVLIVFGLILLVLSIFIGFLARAALIGMVNDVEQEGTTSINQGFRCGWSQWLSLFGINLAIWIPFAAYVILLLILLASPVAASFIFKQTVLGIVLLILAILLFLVAVVPVAIALSLVEFLSDRFRVVKRTRVFESISEGYRAIRSNLGQVVVFWLIMILVGMALGFVLLPVTLLLLAPAFVLIFVNTLLAVLLGIPGVLVLIFLGGLIQVFTSAAWTEFFLELTREKADLVQQDPSS